MPTTTIGVPDELMARIANVAQRAGKTTQCFILEAIEEKTEQEELRKSFEAEDDARFAAFLETRETIPWSEVRKYLEERAAGKQPPRPAAKKFVITNTNRKI